MSRRRDRNGDLVPRTAQCGGNSCRTAAGLQSIPGLAGGGKVALLEGRKPADKQPPVGVGALAADGREAIEGRARLTPRGQVEGLTHEGTFGPQIRWELRRKLGFENSPVCGRLMRRCDGGGVEQPSLRGRTGLPILRIAAAVFLPAGKLRLTSFLIGLFLRAHAGILLKLGRQYKQGLGT